MDAYELCTWGFIINDWVPISRHPTHTQAVAALDAEWKAREMRNQYTDLGTFKVRQVEKVPA